MTVHLASDLAVHVLSLLTCNRCICFSPTLIHLLLLVELSGPDSRGEVRSSFDPTLHRAIRLMQ